MFNKSIVLLSITALLFFLSVSWTRSAKQNPVCHYPIDYSDTTEFTAKVGDFYIDNTFRYRLHRGIDELALEKIDSMANYFKKFNLVVEIKCHTDFRGSTDYNDTFSNRRGEEFKLMFIKKGVSPERLHVVSVGERYPRMLEKDVMLNGETFKKGTLLNEKFINSLKTARRKEAAHYFNRRVEFRIIDIDN